MVDDVAVLVTVLVTVGVPLGVQPSTNPAREKALFAAFRMYMAQLEVELETVVVEGGAGTGVTG